MERRSEGSKETLTEGMTLKERTMPTGKSNAQVEGTSVERQEAIPEERIELKREGTMHNGRGHGEGRRDAERVATFERKEEQSREGSSKGD